jgi:hypothetical protein
MLHGIHGPVKEHFVRLFRPHVGQWIRRLLISASHRQSQQHPEQQNQRIPTHHKELTSAI